MSFKILHTLWVYRLYIYLLIYEIKVVTNILMGFKIWCQVWVWGTQFSKLPYVREFSNIWFQKSTDIIDKRSQRFFENSKKLLVFEFWWVVLIFDYAPTSYVSILRTRTHNKISRKLFKSEKQIYFRNRPSIFYIAAPCGQGFYCSTPL